MTATKTEMQWNNWEKMEKAKRYILPILLNDSTSSPSPDLTPQNLIETDEMKNTMETIKFEPGNLTLANFRKIYEKPVKIALDDKIFTTMEESHNYTKTIVSEKKITYGINTGIGKLACKIIDEKHNQEFQHSLIMSHAVGVGTAASDDIVRLIMVLKINTLALGYSGISRELLEVLITLVNAEIYPHIPLKGSVGASGDLAPLAHLTSVLLGKGKARYKGKWLNGQEALVTAGLKPISLGYREGLAMINGTQVSTAFSLAGLFKAEDMFATAIVCGSLTVEAVLGSRKPFDYKIQKVKGHKAQIDVAAAYRHLFGNSSEASDSHVHCKRVQDPYSIRCQPQVMGACLEQIRHSAHTLLIESNSTSDNPLIFPSAREVISAGNFHAEFVAFAADNLALALAEIGSMSERRTALLMDNHLSGLPEFLVRNSGVNTGFMTAQVTAAALVSENKCLAYPASVDSIPTSSNQEDHVSMAPIGGKRLWEMAENVKSILAIEWMSACQGLDLRDLKTSQHLEKARQILREKVPFLEKDRFMATDIEAAGELISKKTLNSLLPEELMPSW